MTRPIEPDSKTFISQRQILHYVDWGNVGAPTLVLVHGGRDHCRSWDWVADRLRQSWHVVALDLAGHGDSAWRSDGHYTMAGFVFDLAEFIRSQLTAPVTLIGHSLGGNICVRYAGLFPDQVDKLASIEGLGPSPGRLAERENISMGDHLRTWIDQKREILERQERTYPTFEAALARLREAHPRLSDEQARHLAQHGVRQVEVGNWRWKFDPAIRAWPPYEMLHREIETIWQAISAPVLLFHGSESWHTSPDGDGRAGNFATVRVEKIDGAGHWLHHDKFEEFMAKLTNFLSD